MTLSNDRNNNVSDLTCGLQPPFRRRNDDILTNTPDRDYKDNAAEMRLFSTKDDLISSEQYGQQTTCIVRNKHSTIDECDVAPTSQDYNDVSIRKRISKDVLLQSENKLRSRKSRIIESSWKRTEPRNRTPRKSRPNYFSFKLFLLLLISTRCTATIWWSPGTASKLVDTKRICQWARLVGGAPAQLCRDNLPVISKITQGIENGMKECQRSFREYRWDCTQTPRAMFGRVLQKETKQTAYVQAITAAAILHSVTMGCVNGELPECGCGKKSDELKRQFLVLEAAKMNVTLNESRLKEMTETFWWEGCDDDVEYGHIMSQTFLNRTLIRGRNRGSPLGIKISFHNFEAGRLAIKNHMKVGKACHGMTGSCTIPTRWKEMPSLGEVDNILKAKYINGSVLVAGYKSGGIWLAPAKNSRTRRPASQMRRPKSRIRRPTSRVRKPARVQKRRRKPRSALPQRSDAEDSMLRRNRSEHRQNIKKKKNSLNRVTQNSVTKRRKRPRPRRRKIKVSPESLVYSKPSPNFCEKSKKDGSVGTKGRVCSPRVKGPGGCGYLCCGRGYKSKVIQITRKCKCQYEKCCEIVCDDCLESRKIHFCL